MRLEERQDLSRTRLEADRDQKIKTIQSELLSDGLTETRDCIDCGEPLSGERIKAVPGATRCVECQAEFERQARLKR